MHHLHGVAGKALYADACPGNILVPVAIGPGGADQTELLRIMESQRIPAVVPGIGVVDLHSVQIPGNGRGAAVAIGVGLDQQRALPPGDGGEGGDAHAEDLFRLRQQLIRPAVEQIVVLALVKAQLRALEDPQALALAFLPDAAIALQEGADPVALPGGVDPQVLKGGAVEVVGDD